MCLRIFYHHSVAFYSTLWFQKKNWRLFSLDRTIVFYSFYFLNSTDSEKQIEQFALFLSYWERAHLARSHSLSRILENSNFCRTKKKWDFISRKHASRPYAHTKLYFRKNYIHLTQFLILRRLVVKLFLCIYCEI